MQTFATKNLRASFYAFFLSDRKDVRRPYVCCSYSETVIITVLKSVPKIGLVKTEKNIFCS
jgi:hypothetical protein